MMDMVVTRRVNVGMEEAFEAIARQQTILCPETADERAHLAG